ncbi:helix-turn-helix transcriptional regulator [Nodularia harveyana UHCC-0300]|uniref:Helix-turn-helix transcriptional regulator n=1 Tax=Nodularia harveyana UHCC-0300 TaxID=2974287 RepID=A0ABU5UH99_9CYAN|nr:helix-turn-helix transcriptional regulator [Nodularia harveyana]MEA5581791.1 helix-turn-helix transcriptional regulator [Nodularia harveyana UHCC-0300]
MKHKPKPRIALLREKAGLTQLELSRLVGVTESTIQNWESGRTGTDHIERIIRFCKALNCQVEDLIEDMKESSATSVSAPGSLGEIHSLLGTENSAVATNTNADVLAMEEEKFNRNHSDFLMG